MRRRLVLAPVALVALVLLGFGLVSGAVARQSTLGAVRDATTRFHSIEQAENAGYVPFYVCTEEPGQGTMGQHYVNFELVGDPTLDPLHPEALVYEPQANGKYRLVALEWVKVGPVESPAPTVHGLTLKHVPSGNRYGIEPDGFYQIHYWLYQANPAGTFADWNPTVSCLGTGDNGG